MEKMENVLDEIVCKIILQNIRWYKEMNFEPSEYVYFLFEENSGYISSNSSRLHVEEILRRGVSEEDVKEKNIRYREYVRIKEDVERGDIEGRFL